MITSSAGWCERMTCHPSSYLFLLLGILRRRSHCITASSPSSCTTSLLFNPAIQVGTNDHQSHKDDEDPKVSSRHHFSFSHSVTMQTSLFVELERDTRSTNLLPIWGSSPRIAEVQWVLQVTAATHSSNRSLIVHRNVWRCFLNFRTSPSTWNFHAYQVCRKPT